MSDGQNSDIINHTDADPTHFAVVLSVILDGKHQPVENPPRQLEADPVFGDVGQALGVIPLEHAGVRYYNLYEQ